LASTGKGSTLTNNQSTKKAPIKTKALGNIQSEGLKNVMDGFFN
jgi:hypothetical protein